jgi:hypothetical protein
MATEALSRSKKLYGMSDQLRTYEDAKFRLYNNNNNNNNNNKSEQHARKSRS